MCFGFSFSQMLVTFSLWQGAKGPGGLRTPNSWVLVMHAQQRTFNCHKSSAS